MGGGYSGEGGWVEGTVMRRVRVCGGTVLMEGRWRIGGIAVVKC